MRRFPRLDHHCHVCWQPGHHTCRVMHSVWSCVWKDSVGDALLKSMRASVPCAVTLRPFDSVAAPMCSIYAMRHVDHLCIASMKRTIRA
jgi:hypothetical protein